MSTGHGSKHKRPKKDGTEAKRPGKPWIADHSLLLLAGIMLLGLVIRLLPALYTIVGGNVIFLGPDSYYHMRRTVYTVDHFPATNSFDSYVNYPYGFPICWPPLFDVIAAAASLLAGLGHPDIYTMEVAASLVSVLMGVAAIALVYYIAKDVMNEKVGLIAALLLAIVPAGIFRSLFGVVGHHELEVLLSLATFFFFLRAVSGAKKAGAGMASLRQARPLIYTILTGVAMASMIMAWDGAPVFIIVIVAYAFIQYVYDVRNKESSGALTVVGLLSSLLALVVITPLVITSSAAQQNSFNPLQFTWFQILYLTCVVAFFPIMGFISGLLLKRGLPWPTLPGIAIVVGAFALAAIMLALPAFFSGIVTGVQYFFGMMRMLNTISEAEPLFMSLGQPSLTIPWAYFSFAGPIAVLGFIAYLLGLRGKKLSEGEIFFIVWTAVVLVLGLMQKRFLNLLAVNASIFGGYGLYLVLELAGLGQYMAPSDKKRPSASRAGSMSPALMGAIIAILLLLIPVLLNSIYLAGTPEFYSMDWNDACLWVEKNTPPTSFLYSPDVGSVPEYGVMSWWDYGNYILYRAERPAVANNFQTGVDDSALFFISQDEGLSDSIMDKLDAKYVMLDYRQGSPFAGIPFGIFEDMAYLLGQDPNMYHDNGTGNLSSSANSNYYDSMFSRLYYLNGCGGNVSGHPVGALAHYRLLYATRGVDPVKVFEYVKGATITGKAPPGSVVRLDLKMASQYGYGTYDSQAVAGSDGQYAFVVPYATSASAFIRTDGAYTITGAGVSASVSVPESAVLTGATVTPAAHTG